MAATENRDDSGAAMALKKQSFSEDEVVIFVLPTQ